MPAFILALLPYVAGYVVGRFLLMLVSVGVSLSLVVFLYNQVLGYATQLLGNSTTVIMANILALAGVGEALGILFGAFVARTLIRRIAPA